MLLLCLLIVVSLFATTALAAAITPRGSEGAAWTKNCFLLSAMKPNSILMDSDLKPRRRL